MRLRFSGLAARTPAVPSAFQLAAAFGPDAAATVAAVVGV
jgi:hypothetical protein